MSMFCRSTAAALSKMGQSARVSRTLGDDSSQPRLGHYSSPCGAFPSGYHSGRPRLRSFRKESSSMSLG
ncbi:hypothetical protein CEXT_398621 [Caerostris extrusa]|uniref:Uncharacterized protein n=1 Tax=Caerostris extrusa TaxID=172846 RepID=A0AAV4WBV1_CAEEX|nr:hypothetical protein CEXT_398621 [Caerostris extrusa]